MWSILCWDLASINGPSISIEDQAREIVNSLSKRYQTTHLMPERGSLNGLILKSVPESMEASPKDITYMSSEIPEEIETSRTGGSIESVDAVSNELLHQREPKHKPPIKNLNKLVY